MIDQGIGVIAQVTGVMITLRNRLPA